MDFSSEEKIKQIRLEKKEAEAAGDFEKAARLIDEERKLLERMGKPLESDLEAPRLSGSDFAVILLICLGELYVLYQLFVNKVMLTETPPRPVHVDSNDPLFWVYAAAVAIPIPFIIGMIILRFNRFSAMKKGKSME